MWSFIFKCSPSVLTKCQISASNMAKSSSFPINFATVYLWWLSSLKFLRINNVQIWIALYEAKHTREMLKHTFDEKSCETNTVYVLLDSICMYRVHAISIGKADLLHFIIKEPWLILVFSVSLDISVFGIS